MKIYEQITELEQKMAEVPAELGTAGFYRIVGLDGETLGDVFIDGEGDISARNEGEGLYQYFNDPARAWFYVLTRMCPSPHLETI